jgi:predicted Zn-dependent protease
MELYVRAACAVGADSAVDELLRRDDGTDDARVGAARGYLAAGRPADAVRLATGVIGRSPDHAAARAVRGEGLWMLTIAGAELRWSTERVRETIEAFDWLRRRDPTDRFVAQRIARLQLHGLESPELALRSAAPLREAAPTHLTPEMAETLGAVLLANGEAEAALSSLNAALARAPTRVGAYLCRAAAHARLGRSAAARADLARAASLPRSPRELADWRRISEEVEGR